MPALRWWPAVFFPAVLACAAVFWGGQRAPERMWLLLMALLQPAAVLIDHGHFQYNNINLGLTVWSHLPPFHSYHGTTMVGLCVILYLVLFGLSGIGIQRCAVESTDGHWDVVDPAGGWTAAHG